MLKGLNTAPFIMSAREAQEVYDHGMQHLRTLSYLRAQSSLAGRGAQNKCLWLFMPKHHHMQHMLQTCLKERVNPAWYSLMAAESFVGLIGKSCRNLGTYIEYSCGSFWAAYVAGVWLMLCASKNTNTLQVCASVISDIAWASTLLVPALAPHY